MQHTDKAYCIPKNPISDRQQAVCFTQNQRDEVRELGDVAGSLQAESGMHQTNYIVTETAEKLRGGAWPSATR